MTPAAGEPLLALAGVRKAYRGRDVLRGVDLEVRRGEIVALLGANGAGKTTIAEIALGLRAPDGGDVRLFGRDPRRVGRDLRARLGATLERGGLPRPMQVREALVLYGSFWRDPLPPDELLDRLGLARVADAPYRSLSGGERARLALALALVGRPELAVLDEPTAAMDVAARQETGRLLDELRAGGTGILLTTHLVDETRSLADRVAILVRGGVAYAGPPGVVPGRSTARLELDRPADAEALQRLATAGVEIRAAANTVHLLAGPTPEALLGTIAAWLPTSGHRLRSLRIADDDLEAVLLALEGDEEA